MTEVSSPSDPRSLVGRWAFERVVTDRLADEVIHVDGTVELSVQDDGRVRWAEQGTMHRRGADIEVSRVLYVVEREDGWTVTFDDGRDFHPWSPGAQVVHLCGADTYAGLVELGPADADGPATWRVTWEVDGPHKGYVMVTRLTST